MNTDKQYHIGFGPEGAGEYAVLTGDPGRVKAIAAHLDGAHFVASNREYTTYLGTVAGRRVNVTSVGIGGPSMAIGVEELAKNGVHTFVRIGTSGGIDLGVRAGDVAIATAAVRQEGTSFEYLPPAFPAAAHFGVTAALVAAAKKQGYTAAPADGRRAYHVGVVQSKDSFYGEMEPSRMPLGGDLLHLWEVYKRTGVLVSEMECAALFAVATALRVRAGGALLCIWNEERKKALGDGAECHDTAVLYPLVVDAIKALIEG
ncbi:MAG: nucleoside phosphorylase [Clostridiales bacterium]|jgi:uridine phosphorylase|nr:nucleoside phosphorylase [Clostridiales bacterium]